MTSNKFLASRPAAFPARPSEMRLRPTGRPHNARARLDKCAPIVWQRWRVLAEQVAFRRAAEINLAPAQPGENEACFGKAPNQSCCLFAQRARRKPLARVPQASIGLAARRHLGLNFSCWRPIGWRQLVAVVCRPAHTLTDTRTHARWPPRAAWATRAQWAHTHTHRARPGQDTQLEARAQTRTQLQMPRLGAGAETMRASGKSRGRRANNIGRARDWAARGPDCWQGAAVAAGARVSVGARGPRTWRELILILGARGPWSWPWSVSGS